MELYYEQGASRKECEMRIAEKYKRGFHIVDQRNIKIGGFLGFFQKPGIEVGFYFSPVVNRNPPWMEYSRPAPAFWQANDNIEHRQHYTVEQHSRGTTTNLEEEKRKVITAAGKNYDQVISGNETSQQILDVVNVIREKMESKDSFAKEDPPAFARAVELLKLNDFSQKYIDSILERMRKELSLDALEDPEAVQEKLLEWIGESISIYKEEKTQTKPKIMVLVGPTGVGKTTTIAKLAAIFGIGTDEIPSINVRMITIDAFRIGAKAQLESIGNIMEIPVSCVDNKQDLRKEIALFSDRTDLFLIDTIGKSPKDSSKLGEMKEILDACGKAAEFHLVVSSGTKSSDIEDFMRHFEPFNYKSVIITKVDETDRVGNIISALAEKRKPVSYLTDGQTVPVDIRKASVVRFLINLVGFKIDREKIEERFPSGEAEQFKWK